MRIVAALATLVKHLLLGPGKWAPGPYRRRCGLLLAGQAAYPRRHRLRLGRYPAVTVFSMLFTEVLRCPVWKVTIQFT